MSFCIHYLFEVRSSHSNKNVEDGTSHATCNSHLSKSSLGHSHVGIHISKTVTPCKKRESQKWLRQSKNKAKQLQQINNNIRGERDPHDTHNEANNGKAEEDLGWRLTYVSAHSNVGRHCNTWKEKVQDKVVPSLSFTYLFCSVSLIINI
jgi:hypothetical protein